MKYLLLALLGWLPLRVIRLFSPIRGERTLVIQTAKIGDWINTTPLLRALAPVDVLCHPVNAPLTRYDSHLASVYFLPAKAGVRHLLGLAWCLFKGGYQQVFILMPSLPNMLLARLACARQTAWIEPYQPRISRRLMGLGWQSLHHDREALALDNYLRLAGIEPSEDNRAKYATWPLHEPAVNQVMDTGRFRVGISLSAGNALKTLPDAIWRRLFALLSDFPVDLHIFGLAQEREHLERLRGDMVRCGLRVIDCLGAIPLEELPWSIGQMQLYISTDTGNSYIADSQQVPLLCFSGPCQPAEQRPLGERALIVETRGLRPFTFVFATSYQSNLSSDQLYAVDAEQWESIKQFLSDLHKDFQWQRSSC